MGAIGGKEDWGEREMKPEAESWKLGEGCDWHAVMEGFKRGAQGTTGVGNRFPGFWHHADWMQRQDLETRRILEGEQARGARASNQAGGVDTDSRCFREEVRMAAWRRGGHCRPNELGGKGPKVSGAMVRWQGAGCAGL